MPFVDAAGHFAPQQNVPVALYYGFQVEIVQHAQGVAEVVDIGKRGGDDRDRHNQIAGKKYFLFPYMDHADIWAGARGVDNVDGLAAQADYHALVKDDLGQANVHFPAAPVCVPWHPPAPCAQT